MNAHEEYLTIIKEYELLEKKCQLCDCEFLVEDILGLNRRLLYFLYPIIFPKYNTVNSELDKKIREQLKNRTK